MKNIKETQSIFSIYRNRRDIRRAIQSLRQMGVHTSDISVLVPPGGSDFETPDIPYRERRQIGKGAGIGLIAGFVIWGFIALMVVMDVFPIAFVSQLPMWGKILAFLGGALSGGLVGAAAGTLIGVGTPPPAEERYENYVRSGGILLSVHVENSDREKAAKKVIEKTGGGDVNSLDEVRGWTPVLLDRALGPI